jgi:hypothetical protein
MLAPFALSDLTETSQLGTPWRLGLVALSLVLAWSTKVLVEDRGMAWGPLTRSSKLTFTSMVAGLAVVTVLAGGLQWTYQRHVAQAERDVAAGLSSPCHGARAMIAANGCTAPFGPAGATAMGPANEYWRLAPECGQAQDFYIGENKHNMATCDFSGGSAAAEKVWLLGDSHAQHWAPAIFEIARERRWLLKVAYLGGCPLADVRIIDFRGRPIGEPEADRCSTWGKRMTEVVTDDKPSLVLMSFLAREETLDDRSGRSQAEQYRTGLEPMWRKWTDAGVRVAVLADPPFNDEVRSPDCVTLHPANPLACTAPRGQAHPSDPLVEVARKAANPGVSVIDLTDYFCDEQKCYSVIGNVAVYYDQNHLNSEFSRSLAPMIAKALG